MSATNRFRPAEIDGYAESSAGPATVRPLVSRAIAVVPAWAWQVLGIYFTSRLLFFIVAGGDSIVQHTSLATELANWDGKWYLLASQHGYPHELPTKAGDFSTLGFLPLYPVLMWLLLQLPGLNALGAGLAISISSGAIATLAISRLAASWWDEPTSRQAMWFFCLFPGTIVFSMVYSEGVELACVALALLALQDGRWFRAGAFGMVATLTAATATVLIPVALIAAVLELRKHDLRAWRSWLVFSAPVLTALGLVAFGIFLWFWAGTPMATFKSQQIAWNQHTTPLAFVHLVTRLFGDVFLGHTVPPGFGPWGDSLNDFNGVIGTCVLLWAFWIIWRQRHRIHFTALLWTVGIFLVTITSPTSPPNARMLVSAFPALLAIGATIRGRWRWLLIGVELVMLVVMSYFTYVGQWLLP